MRPAEMKRSDFIGARRRLFFSAEVFAMSSFFSSLNAQSLVLIRLALMLLAAFGLSRIAKLLKLPNVTGYIISGIIIGPYVTGLIPKDMVDSMSFLTDAALKKMQLGIAAAPEKALSGKLSALSEEIAGRAGTLKEVVDAAPASAGLETESRYYHDVAVKAMDALRRAVDEAELLVASDYWPYPSYGKLLFGVK